LDYHGIWAFDARLLMALSPDGPRSQSPNQDHSDGDSEELDIDGVHGDRLAMRFSLLSISALAPWVRAPGDQCDRRDRKHPSRRTEEWPNATCASSAVRGNKPQ